MSAADIGITPKFLRCTDEELLQVASGTADASADALAVKLESCLFARSRHILRAMERQTVPATMLSYLVTAMLCTLDELDARYDVLYFVSFCLFQLICDMCLYTGCS